MTPGNFIRNTNGAVLTEMLIGAVMFVIVGLVVAHFALHRHGAPVTELQTEPERPRLIATD
jgi:hypothetical protein